MFLTLQKQVEENKFEKFLARQKQENKFKTMFLSQKQFEENKFENFLSLWNKLFLMKKMNLKH